MVSPISRQNPVFIDTGLERTTPPPSGDVFHPPIEPFFPTALGFVVGSGKIFARSGPPVFQQGRVLFPAAVGGIASAVAGLHVFLGGAMAGLLPVLPWVLLGVLAGIAVGSLIYGLQWNFEQKTKPMLSQEECIEKIKQYRIAAPEIPVASLVSQFCPELKGLVALEPARFVAEKWLQLPLRVFDPKSQPPKKNEGETIILKDVPRAAKPDLSPIALPPFQEEMWGNEGGVADYRHGSGISFSGYVHFNAESIFERWAENVADRYLVHDFENPAEMERIYRAVADPEKGLKQLPLPVSRDQIEQVWGEIQKLHFSRADRYLILPHAGRPFLFNGPQLWLHVNVPFDSLPDFLRAIHEELRTAPIPVGTTIDTGRVYPFDDPKNPSSQGHDIVTIVLQPTEVDRDLDLVLTALLHAFAEAEPFTYGSNEFPHLIHAWGGAVLISPSGSNYTSFFRRVLESDLTVSGIFSPSFASRLAEKPAREQKEMIVEALKKQRNEAERCYGLFYNRLFPGYYCVRR